MTAALYSNSIEMASAVGTYSYDSCCVSAAASLAAADPVRPAQYITSVKPV